MTPAMEMTSIPCLKIRESRKEIEAVGGKPSDSVPEMTVLNQI
jgi:hypothetical protein